MIQFVLGFLLGSGEFSSPPPPYPIHYWYDGEVLCVGHIPHSMVMERGDDFPETWEKFIGSCTTEETP